MDLRTIMSMSPAGFASSGSCAVLRLASLIAAIVVFAVLAQAEEPKRSSPSAGDDGPADLMRDMQTESIESEKPVYGHWGTDADKFSSWTNHSNRLVPVYTFGLTLSEIRERGSVYSDPQRLKKLSDRADEGAVNPHALYYDQTDIYHLQRAAFEAGYSNIILMVFDGMDWQTTRAAATYKQGAIKYDSGRGTGLAFLDDRRTVTDFGLVCTSAAADGAKFDVDAQRVLSVDEGFKLGYDVQLAGPTPWHERNGSEYLVGRDRARPHTVTDSASSATSLCSGIKTYNGAINFAVDGSQVVPLARELQRDQDFMIGIVSSVPVSHATPASAYANNVTRKDYQDISRDLVGLPSASHRNEPLPGVDVLIGGGWGEGKQADKVQGTNFAQGNNYFHQDDIRRIDLKNGGAYRVVQRKSGRSGSKSLLSAAQTAADNGERLFGFFGVKGGHIPFATADGRYDPTVDVKVTEEYTQADIDENPTLAEMTEAALLVLEQSIDGFWLMIEAGDVDWANHANNLDNSIGAVLSGDEAFVKVMDWVDENNAWDHTAVIITADHGHYLVIDHPEKIAEAGAANNAAKRASGE